MRTAGALVIAAAMMLGLYFLLGNVKVTALSTSASCGPAVYAWLSDTSKADQGGGSGDIYGECVTAGRANTLLGLSEGFAGTLFGLVMIAADARWPRST